MNFRQFITESTTPVTAQAAYKKYRSLVKNPYQCPFDSIICTNTAMWLKQNYFPQGKIVGYHTEDNPHAQVGADEGG